MASSAAAVESSRDKIDAVGSRLHALLIQPGRDSSSQRPFVLFAGKVFAIRNLGLRNVYIP